MQPIAAISTPAGVGGLAVVRLSGDGAKDIACQFVAKPLDHQARLSTFTVGGVTIDEVVVTWFKAPNSYTGEDVVEIACHGSLYVQQAILQALIGGGARLAEAGEFTRRAFLNGKLDLSQAEAVGDLINSTLEASNRLAISQLRGGYRQKLKEMRQELLDLTTLLELELDFSQEDVEFADRQRLLALTRTLLNEAERLAASFSSGNAVKNGIRVAIVGPPNAGKSTLLNALADDDRAIVSDQPGTTRDTIEETCTIDGILCRFIDTAGLRHSADPIEAAGIERSRRAAHEADLLLYVADATCTEPHDSTAHSLLEVHHGNVPTIIALNKSDLCANAEHTADELAHLCGNATTLAISAKEQTGLESLKHAIVEPFRQGGDDVVMTNLRHYDAMLHLAEALRNVQQGLATATPTDLVAVDLRDAVYHIGTITGEVTTNEILTSIFSRFCIGK